MDISKVRADLELIVSRVNDVEKRAPSYMKKVKELGPGAAPKGLRVEAGVVFPTSYYGVKIDGREDGVSGLMNYAPDTFVDPTANIDAHIAQR